MFLFYSGGNNKEDSEFCQWILRNSLHCITNTNLQWILKNSPTESRRRRRNTLSQLRQNLPQDNFEELIAICITKLILKNKFLHIYWHNLPKFPYNTSLKTYAFEMKHQLNTDCNATASGARFTDRNTENTAFSNPKQSHSIPPSHTHTVNLCCRAPKNNNEFLKLHRQWQNSLQISKHVLKRTGTHQLNAAAPASTR